VTVDLGPHAVFIVAAYAVTAAVVVGLILWAALDQRAQRRALVALEARGMHLSSDTDAPRPTRERSEGAAGEAQRSARAG